MVVRLISLMMSALMAFSSASFCSFNEVIDSFGEAVFGVPVTADSLRTDFLSEIIEEDITKTSENSGFLNNKIMVFVDGEANFFERRNIFKDCGGTLVGWSRPANLYVVHYLFPLSYDELNKKCDELLKKEGVELAFPIAARKSETMLDGTPNDSFDKDPNSIVVWDEKSPNGRNWHLEAIQARQAWDYSNYFSTVNIGIVDAGYDLSHPDLKGKITFPDTLRAMRNSADEHGSHVAGIIGARHNNSVGAAGVCDNSNLICVDWEPTLFQFWFSELAIFFGFSSLVQAGAKAVNFSLGTSSSLLVDGTGYYEETLVPMAVSYMMSSLLSNGYDFVAVQSAGNGDALGNPIDARFNGHFSNINESNIYVGSNNVSNEDILNRIIIVGSVSNEGDGKYVQSDFSNIGSRIDIAAPGEDIFSCLTDSKYGEMSGTSMAAPIVTGVASLVWSVNPSFSGAQVKEMVCTSYESVAQINTQMKYSDESLLTEYPVVNAKLAVENAIKRSYSSVGTVSGKVDKSVAELEFNGVSHTVFSDGSFSFVTPSASGIAKAKDSSGNVVATFNIAVKDGETTFIY